MAIGRRGVDEDRIQRQRPGLEEARDVGQEDRHVVRPSLVHGRPRVRPDEQGAVAKVRRHVRGQVRTRPLDVEVDDADIVQLRRPRDECVEQHRWRGRGAMNVDLVARPDALDGLGGSDDLHP